MTKKWKWPPFGQKGTQRAILILVILSVFLFQLGLHLLSVKFSLYLYTEERYTHEIGDTAEEKIGALASPVTVRFCMPHEDLKADVVYSLVYNSAEQYAEKYNGKIRISNDPINIYTDIAEVEAYREKTDAYITKTSVIVESAVNTRVLDMQDFFILDSESMITAYNGEEVFLGFFMWVQTPEDSHEKIYFTVDHGETVSLSSLQSRCLLSGYLPTPIQLSKEEIPEDAAAVFILNPIYDFEKSAEDGLSYAELDRLEKYLDAGGNLFVTLNPASESYARLDNLRGFLSDYGIAAGDTVLLDSASSVQSDGKLLLSSFLRDGEAGRILTREPAHLTYNSQNEKNAVSEVFVETFESASEGTATGTYPIAGVSTLAGGGHIFTALSGYLFYNDAMDTDAYANRRLFYTVLTEFGCENTPEGTLLPIQREVLENLTAGESNVFLIVTAVVIPVVVLLCGTVVLVRRRRS